MYAKKSAKTELSEKNNNRVAVFALLYSAASETESSRYGAESNTKSDSTRGTLKGTGYYHHGLFAAIVVCKVTGGSLQHQKAQNEFRLCPAGGASHNWREGSFSTAPRRPPLPARSHPREGLLKTVPQQESHCSSPDLRHTFTHLTSLVQTPSAMPPASTAATEAQILKSYLLNPASLPTIITFEEFRDLFPASQQSHFQVKLLYRDLQFLRTVDTDLIEENIAKECRDGERQRRELYRALHQQSSFNQQSGAQSNGNQDVQMDEVLYGQTGSVAKRKKRHTKDSLMKEMEETIRYLEVDALVAKREADKLLGQMREKIGNLSNVRNGHNAGISDAGNGVEAEVVQSLKGLEDAINQNSIHQ